MQPLLLPPLVVVVVLLLLLLLTLRPRLLGRILRSLLDLDLVAPLLV
jgi:hypothetical protein